VLRGTAGPTWEVVTAALLAGGVPVGRTPADGSLLVLVDPVAADWPAPDVAAPPVVLVCGAPPPRAEVLTALLRGARAVLSAERVPTDLVPACTLAVRGHVTVDPDAARAVLDAVHAPFTAPGLPDLTARELDILGLIAAGHTVRQTARALGIAEKTVENTQSRLYRKLGARNRSGALVTAHALGLLEHPEPETAR
jgi:DNA-binding NarL/FixJ family response regulator